VDKIEGRRLAPENFKVHRIVQIRIIPMNFLVFCYVTERTVSYYAYPQLLWKPFIEFVRHIIVTADEIFVRNANCILPESYVDPLLHTEAAPWR
jgi:hypothetical protein